MALNFLTIIVLLDFIADPSVFKNWWLLKLSLVSIISGIYDPVPVIAIPVFLLEGELLNYGN